MTLEVRDLRYTYPGWPPTLEGAELEVPAGSSGFLLGPSGCGKSTLLRCIAGLDTRYTGTVSWDGAPLDQIPPHKRGVGMMFQEPALFPHLNVWRNVAFGLRYRAVPRAERRQEAERWLGVVNFNGREEARVDELSGGQRQRVALARTLAAKPRVVLLDEPFSGLDRDLRDELGPRVKAILAGLGVAALWVTHDRDEAMRLGDRVWRMEEGRCVAAAPK
ncbi:MAG TPA: ABC transporter ATP-binding protein [Candidatus Thermoplasmatota archaeon]|nr:ABC transporter ATP-binding protein [Candidatus Thermoplasmatota archaeon]